MKLKPAFLLAALAVFTPAVDAAGATRPNIVFILADDLGRGDLGCYGQTKIKTPHLDRMAAEGMKFTSFYAGCSVCAPSRCTLMTGEHLGHATVRDNMQRAPGKEGQHRMEPGTVTVAQLLKKAGYATAIVGKWGLGMPEDQSSPLDFVYEGGIRTPFLARWPGRIKAGATSDFVGAFWDVLPTLCELAGISCPAGIDGVSIVPTLLGQPGQRQHDHLYWEYHGEGGRQAVRFGEWKAVRNAVRKAPRAIPDLYNLATDPGEKNNVAAQHPDISAKAAALMKISHVPSWEPEWNFPESH